ncbi:MAG: hypothetical protein ABI548_13265 [Polyangiaceae bacterium]
MDANALRMKAGGACIKYFGWQRIGFCSVSRTNDARSNAFAPAAENVAYVSAIVKDA